MRRENLCEIQETCWGARSRALRWPLAVGRWPLAVGRWPFCAALVAGGLLMLAPQARAGRWEQVDIGTSETDAAWIAKSSELRIGHRVDTSERYVASNGFGYVYGRDTPPTLPLSSNVRKEVVKSTVDTAKDRAGIWITGLFAAQTYGATTRKVDWSVRGVWNWRPNKIRDNQGNFIDDPNDKPPLMFYARIKGQGYAEATCVEDYKNAYALDGAHAQFTIDMDAKSSTVTLDQTQPNLSPSSRIYVGKTKEWLVPVWTGGQSHVVSPFIKANVDASVDARTYSVTYGTPGGTGSSTPSTTTWPTSGSVEDFFKADISRLDLALWISSDIEKSWKKFEGILPFQYQQLNASKFLEPNPDYAVQLSGDTLAMQGVFKLACQRDPDGSMTVESAATPFLGTSGSGNNPADYTGNLFWYGGGSFTANTLGFTSPTYSWDIGTVTGASTSNPFTVVGYQQTNPFGSPGNSLGTGPHLPKKSSTVKVTVTGSPSNPTLTSTCKVNWHEPLENTSITGVLQKGTKYDGGASDWAPMNTPINVTLQPGSVVWSYLGGGTALLSAAGVVFLSGDAAPVFDLVMTDANYGITTLAPTAQVIQKNFTYDDYAQAIQREQDIQTRQAPPTNCPTVAGLTPGDLAIAFGGLTSSGNANADPFWSGRPRGKFVVATPWETDQWQGDIYDHNGFSNVTNYTITGDKTIDYVAQVSFGGITQMMAPPSP